MFSYATVISTRENGSDGQISTGFQEDCYNLQMNKGFL